MVKRKFGRYILIGFLLAVLSVSALSLAVYNRLEKNTETPLYKIRVSGEIEKLPTIETKFISSKKDVIAEISLAFPNSDEELVTMGRTCRFTQCYGTFFCTNCGIWCRLTFPRPICKAMPVDSEEPILQ